MVMTYTSQSFLNALGMGSGMQNQLDSLIPDGSMQPHDEFARQAALFRANLTGATASLTGTTASLIGTSPKTFREELQDEVNAWLC